MKPVRAGHYHLEVVPVLLRPEEVDRPEAPRERRVQFPDEVVVVLARLARVDVDGVVDGLEAVENARGIDRLLERERNEARHQNAGYLVRGVGGGLIDDDRCLLLLPHLLPEGRDLHILEVREADVVAAGLGIEEAEDAVSARVRTGHEGRPADRGDLRKRDLHLGEVTEFDELRHVRHRAVGGEVVEQRVRHAVQAHHERPVLPASEECHVSSLWRS